MSMQITSIAPAILSAQPAQLAVPVQSARPIPNLTFQGIERVQLSSSLSSLPSPSSPIIDVATLHFVRANHALENRVISYATITDVLHIITAMMSRTATLQHQQNELPLMTREGLQDVHVFLHRILERITTLYSSVIHANAVHLQQAAINNVRTDFEQAIPVAEWRISEAERRVNKQPQ